MPDTRPNPDLAPAPPPVADAPAPAPGDLGEVSRLALKLGCIAFGGPAAHIAMLHDEVVSRRRWLTNQAYLDLVGATNLIPGPNSTEMMIHVGLLRAGWRGLIAAGFLFILPAALITLAFAWAYATYGTTPTATALLYGIKPVVIAIVGLAIWHLASAALRPPRLVVLAIGAVALYLLGVNELPILAAGAVIMLAATLVAPPGRLTVLPLVAAGSAGLPGWLSRLLPNTAPGSGVAVLGMVAAAAPVSLGAIFLIFLKIGSVLYGGGYVLLAFLRTELVTGRGWLTDQQLLDAVAVGQVTPGPLFSTATFVGYLLAGVPGAALATIGIFLPSFVFVALLHRVLPRLRKQRWTAALLDGVNVAALGVMAGVLWELGRDAIVDWRTAVLTLVALGLLLRFRLNSAWLVAGGGLAGVVLNQLS